MVRQIRLQEFRDTEGPDRNIPRILADDVPYDVHLDRFFLWLPLNGTRSRHSLRAIGYDITVWLRYLEQARENSIWTVSHDDLIAFHGARRQSAASHRISAETWNRSIASLDKLYRWGVDQKLISVSPFRHRKVWRGSINGRRAALVDRNMAYEPAGARSNIRFVSLETYRIFSRVGLRGLLTDGHNRPGARDRNGMRNALFADLLVSTGLRLEEASSLLASEIAEHYGDEGSSRQVRFMLPPPITKGNRGRTILIPRRIISRLQDYIEIERSTAVGKFISRQGWERIARPIFVERLSGDALMFSLSDGSTAHRARFDPEERLRLVLCKDGIPIEPAALWLSEIGLPTQFNSWEAIFLRASRRCSELGHNTRLSPHQLRHTFAVHMLAMLIEQQIGRVAQENAGMEAYRQLLGDPLQQVQRLLGHASIATTYIYLDQIAAQADTVDTAIERLLSVLTDGYVL